MALLIKNQPSNAGNIVRFMFDPWVWKIDLLEEGLTTHSSILAWRIPWMEEPGGL